MATIAEAWGWTEPVILDLDAASAFYYAARATRARWQRIDDMRMAACFAKLDEHGRQNFLGQLNFMLSGPGRVVKWEETLTERQRQAATEAEAKAEATYTKLAERGILVNADGTKPPQMMLGN